MKRIIVTGDRGYIGSVLVPMLMKRGHKVMGLDIGHFHGCLLYPESKRYFRIEDDISVSGGITWVDIKGADAVIHLAALSNDPLGERDPKETERVNRDASICLARTAKECGVRRFVYASSQSMYGVSNTDAELDEDNSEKNPVTTYARTKWEAECGIKALADDSFTVVCLRPSTVFGVSPRLRCDIVFNNFVACAYTTGKIEVHSDGSPWRPVVHIRDVCSAFIAALEAPASIVQDRSYNVGIPNGNFTVRELAEAAQRAVPGSTLTFTGGHKDPRSYRVSFQRILTELKDYYKPEWGLDRGGKELVDLFRRINFTEEQFRGRMCNRLKQLEWLGV